LQGNKGLICLTAGLKLWLVLFPLQATEDFRNDYKLFTACKDDVMNLCSEVEPGDGRELECLVSSSSSVGPAAKQQREGRQLNLLTASPALGRRLRSASR
jgi:hypothetical protein